MPLSHEYQTIKNKLDEVSPCFCAAKWLQTTIHLQNGNSHSCHHPDPQQVSLEEIKNNPAALNNSKHIKKMRQMMKNGERPQECFYCWLIEDSSKNNFSDRVFKSCADWAKPYIDDIVQHDINENITPTFLEVSFGNECNMACSYCRLDCSSQIFSEIAKYGDYLTPDYPSSEWVKKQKKYPLSKGEDNPYVDAFWKWFPDTIEKLQTFRVTGGEPLINKNTFKLLDYLIDNPHPNLAFSINSNLCVNEQQMQLFYEKLDLLTSARCVKDVTIYASIDGYGPNAEYSRFGLDYNLFLSRLEYLRQNFPEMQIYLMCTYNVLSVINFKRFLQDIYNLRKEYFEKQGHPHNPIGLDISHLTNPEFLAITTMRKKYGKHIEQSIEFMKNHKKSSEAPFGFDFVEINKMSRIYDWFISHDDRQDPAFHWKRYNFHLFFQEYDKRKNIDFAEYCPEYLEHLDSCKNSYIYLTDTDLQHIKEVAEKRRLK